VQKRQSSQQCHLVLLGPTSVKAARKMLVKLTPAAAALLFSFEANVHISHNQLRVLHTKGSTSFAVAFCHCRAQFFQPNGTNYKGESI